MYEDRTQNYDAYNPYIHEKYLIYMIHHFACHIIYSHVQTIAINTIITLKGNDFML